MSELELVRHGVGRGGELDAFEAQALAVAASAAAPNTRRSYAASYRAFAAFLRAHCGEASIDTFTVAAVAACATSCTLKGLAPSSIALRVAAVRRLTAAVAGAPSRSRP